MDSKGYPVDQIENESREAEQVRRAADVVRLGAREQWLDAGTDVSPERLRSLYEDVTGSLPPHADAVPLARWFETWQPNVHASLFIGLWRYLRKFSDAEGVEAIIRAFRMYLGYLQATSVDPVLTADRAWTVVRHLGELLGTNACSRCGIEFASDAPKDGNPSSCDQCIGMTLHVADPGTA